MAISASTLRTSGRAEWPETPDAVACPHAAGWTWRRRLLLAALFLLGASALLASWAAPAQADADAPGTTATQPWEDVVPPDAPLDRTAGKVAPPSPCVEPPAAPEPQGPSAESVPPPAPPVDAAAPASPTDPGTSPAEVPIPADPMPAAPAVAAAPETPPTVDLDAALALPPAGVPETPPTVDLDAALALPPAAAPVATDTASSLTATATPGVAPGTSVVPAVRTDPQPDSTAGQTISKAGTISRAGGSATTVVGTSTGPADGPSPSPPPWSNEPADPPAPPSLPSLPAPLPAPAPPPAGSSAAASSGGPGCGPGQTRHDDGTYAVLGGQASAEPALASVRPTSGSSGAVAGDADNPGIRPG